MSNSLIFADGSVLEGATAGYDGNRNLWLYTDRMDAMQAMAFVSVPGRLDRIEAKYTTMSDIYEGFTQFCAIVVEKSYEEGKNDMIKIRLTGDNIHIIHVENQNKNEAPEDKKEDET